jgi:hypothetical protein
MILALNKVCLPPERELFPLDLLSARLLSAVLAGPIDV